MTQDSGSPAFRYYAFISYSHQDKAWADWLHKVLETYAVPKRLVGRTTTAGVIPKRLTPIFRDRDELASAHDLDRKVNEALAQSANLIVICSPRSAASHWVQQEILAYKRLGRVERIFCLIVDGEPNASDLPGHEAEECFAATLRFQLDADGQPSTRRAEPIAADARSGKDGKGNAKLKLIAGLLDVGFDVLKQRELHRHNRRLAIIATFAVAMMAITSTLAVAALFSRHAAEVARTDAQRRQKQAEDLVGFMLGDLNDKLTAVGRLDIMASVDDQAMAYFTVLPTRDVTEQALAQRAKALEKIGGVRMYQGHLPAALESYQAALKLDRMLAVAAPHDASRQLAWANIWGWIGMTHWNMGQLDRAQHDFESAQRILEQAQVPASDRAQLNFQRTSMYNNIGHVLEARGLFEQAALQYQRMLAICQSLVAEQPQQSTWSVQLGTAHNNLGKLALLHGDLATAVREYAADDVIESRVLASDRNNADQQANAMVSRAILGRTLALAGDVDTGLRDLQQAIEIATQLSNADPSNTSDQEFVALYSSQASRLLRLGGDAAAARSLIDRALAIFASLVAHDPANSTWQLEYAEARLEQAAQFQRAGSFDMARAQTTEARHMLDPLIERQPNDRSTMLAVITATLRQADFSTDAAQAGRLRVDAIDRIDRVTSAQADPRLIALKVQALLALARKSEAQPLIRHLWAGGYRDGDLLALMQAEQIEYPLNTVMQDTLLSAALPGGER